MQVVVRQAGDTTCSVPAVRDGCVYHVTRLAGGKPRCVGGSSGSVQANGCPASSCVKPGRRWLQVDDAFAPSQLFREDTDLPPAVPPFPFQAEVLF